MAQYMMIFAAALVFSMAGTPLAKAAALRLGVVDQPSARKIHVAPVPLLGGAAIYLAFMLALFVFGQRFYLTQLLSILLGASMMTLLGIWDDKWGLTPLLKLAGQFVAAGILIISGIRVEFLHNEILGLIATLVWVVGITNAMNFLDNMDGLSAGVTAVASSFMFLLAAFTGQFLVATMSAAMVGACLGFLYYNFFKSGSIFMGDTGSLFLGYTLAALGIKLRFPQNYDIVTWMIPILVLGLPIFDTTLVTVSRIRRHIPVTRAGKDHLSHRLVSLGLTRREAVMACCLVGGALGMSAMFVMQATISEGYIVGATTLVAGIAGIVCLEIKASPGGSR